MLSLLRKPFVKLFTIIFVVVGFLFYQNAARAAITVVEVSAAGATTDVTTQTVISFTPAANTLYLLWATQTFGSTPATPTVSCANGLTMVQENTVTFGTIATPTRRITLFRGLRTTAGTNNTCTITWGQTSTGGGYSLVSFAGVDTSGTNGSGAVAQSVTGATNSAGTTGLSITLASIISGSTTAGGFSNARNTANSLSAGTGYTAGTSWNFNTPTTSARAEWNTTGSATVNMTQSNANVNIAGIAVEVKQPATPAIPTVTSPTATSITTTGATLGANVTSLGVPASISARGTCWGTSPTPVTNCVAEGGTTTGVFTHARTGMSPNTLYYYRGYATNTTGTGYSADGTFTTLAITGSVSASPTTCTILSGASTCTVPFTWSISNATSPNLYNATTNNTYSTSASGSGVSYPITNGSNTVQARDSSTVLASTVVTASCTSGTSWNGSICAATPAIPTVASPTATSITTTGATLGANVTSLGVPASISARGTCWGTTAAPVTNCVAEGGTTTGVFTHARTGMSPNTLYYYRGYATNSTGTGYSADGTFTTLATGTTMADGAAPTSATIAPGSGIVDLDYFTLQTNTGSDTVTAATVTLAPTGAFNNIGQVDITNNSNSTVCTGVTNPASLTISFTTCNIPVTTSATTYKIRITPKTHTNIDPPSTGVSYATTGTVTSFTSSNTHTGSDVSSATITVDNLSPVNVSGASGSAGDTETTISWTNPGDIDFHSTIVLRHAGSAVVDTPAEGAVYTNSSTIGASTVVCVVPSSSALCNDIGLTNGTAYYYKIFTKDTNSNYGASGTVPAGSPLTPSSATVTITATSGLNGTVTPTGVSTVTRGSDVLYHITPDSGYNVATLVIDGSSIATSTTYTFGNVQVNHTISATFSAIPIVTFTITSGAAAHGSISPLGATIVNQGADQIFDLIPDSGYNVDTLTVDGGSVATSTPYTFTNVQTEHTINVTFIAIVVPLGSFIINATAGTGGAITPLGSTLVTQGANQSYTIAPDSGYNIDTLTVDSISIATTTSYTFTNVQTTHSIGATFVAIPPPAGSFNITATSGTGGTVTPSGITGVVQANDQAYTITPDAGYNIATLVIDGSSVATSTSYTFINIQAAHTISATFTAILNTVITTDTNKGVSRPTTITFFGKAFTGGNVSISNKFPSKDTLTEQEVTPSADGSFRISFIGILQGLQSFGLIAKDRDGHSSQTKFFSVDTSSQDFLEKEILIAPTSGVLTGQITRGENVSIMGYASPANSVRIYIDDILIKEISAKNDGSYTLKTGTGSLAFGQHNVKVKQADTVSGKESDFSTSRTFIVSQLSVVKADFSGDGKIDIRDWSIFLSRWLSKNQLERSSIDLTDDGKADISDFSIFIRAIKRAK